MANALTFHVADLQANAIHQFLHGYSDGHRLIEGSLKLPNDLARLMLQMSDLSGSSVMSGFEQYITGYPLASINAYALAMTWYASEMPRPGCVWTHTLVLSADTLSTIPSLLSLRTLFKRPQRDALNHQYTKMLHLKDFLFGRTEPLERDAIAKLVQLLDAFYNEPDQPVVIISKNAEEFTEPIFALWSQQWPSLRQSVAFCTGSLSGRRLGERAFDIQCCPEVSAKEVAREAGSAVGKVTMLPSTVPMSIKLKLEEDVKLEIAEDAATLIGGYFRQFLWSVSDSGSTRRDFVSYATIYEMLATNLGVGTLVDFIADRFPQPESGSRLKLELLDGSDWLWRKHTESEILRELATTDKYSSFASVSLSDSFAAGLFSKSRPLTSQLVVDLFGSNLNPLGDDILKRLVRAMGPEDAQGVVNIKPQLLPTLFQVNPELASSARLWSLAEDSRRELLEAVVQQEIGEELVHRVVTALLDSDSDRFINRAFERWGNAAVFAALDWTESHDGKMSETCRGALTFHVNEVMTWVEAPATWEYGCARSTPSLAAAARVVAPYACQIANHDSRVWLETCQALQKAGREEEAMYVRTLLLALGLCDAPPEPLDLIEESFETIYKKVEAQQLKDSAWIVLQPLLPELSWWNNWDKCERMRRALLSAFMRHSWPAWELRKRVKNPEILDEVLGSVHKVGGTAYFENT